MLTAERPTWAETPYARTYPAVKPVRFSPSPKGYRDHAEMAEFCGLSVPGFNKYLRLKEKGGYGPKRTKTAGETVPVGSCTDEAVATWLIGLTMTEQSLLYRFQHSDPAESITKEAYASRLSLIEATRKK